MKKRHALAGLVLLAAVLGPPRHARADGLTAEALFQDGRRLRERGKMDEACSKFEASQAAQPSVGALMNLVDCATGRGQTATAWLHLREAESLAARLGDGRRAREAAEQAAALEPKLARIVVEAETPGPELAIERDGVAVTSSSLGTAVPVDPGAHKIVASAAGKAPWTASVQAEPGKSLVVRVPALRAVSAAPAAAAPDTVASPSRTRAPVWPWIVGGAGVACLAGSGLVFLGAAGSASDVRSQCPDGRCPDRAALDQAQSERDSASRSALASTIVGAVGIALVATAVVALVGRSAAPDKARATAR